MVPGGGVPPHLDLRWGIQSGYINIHFLIIFPSLLAADSICFPERLKTATNHILRQVGLLKMRNCDVG